MKDFIDFYEETHEEEVNQDKDRLENSGDIISEFINMFNESLRLRKQGKILWLMQNYAVPNNFKLLFEWINDGLAKSQSLERQDNLAQSQENVLKVLFNNDLLQIQDIQNMITVLERREINGHSDRPRKMLEFHLKRIQANEIIDNNTAEDEPGIKEKLEEAFKFMLKTDLRSNEHILSFLDYDRLIEWTTMYFTNDFSLPNISNPIKSVNTSKGNVIYTFLLFFKIEYPGYRRPDSLFDLIKACFYPYRNEKVENMRKTKKPQYYRKLNKYGEN
ncbi:hypothetical protein [Cyclobacterium plantarum]|uniref:hypothetical protein n=1 Tax=Cyclobacterium plantarum TaxID=2716263 RepID=UPI003F7223A9